MTGVEAWPYIEDILERYEEAYERYVAEEGQEGSVLDSVASEVRRDGEPFPHG